MAEAPAEKGDGVRQLTDTNAPAEKGDREAAKYRTRLREAEAQRDELSGRLAAMQRSEVERLASKQMTNPSALWAAGADLDGLLDENGLPDAEKVAAAAVAAVDALGLAKPKPALYVPNEGKTPTWNGSNDWESAFDL